MGFYRRARRIALRFPSENNASALAEGAVAWDLETSCRPCARPPCRRGPSRRVGAHPGERPGAGTVVRAAMLLGSIGVALDGGSPAPEGPASRGQAGAGHSVAPRERLGREGLVHHQEPEVVARAQRDQAGLNPEVIDVAIAVGDHLANPWGQTYFQFSSSGLGLAFIACSQPE